ncbi:MAG: hypothetical protein ACRELF_01360 [Gemmataceae bacterium]
MQAVSRILAFALVGLLLSLSALGAQDKDKKAAPKKDADKAKAKPAEKMIKVGTFGPLKVTRVDEAKKSLRIEYTNGKKKEWVDWHSIDDVKVRMVQPPPAFDDKGNPKRYTRKELRELKGDPKLPGYPAEFSDLKPGQYVQVTLVRKRGVRRRPKDAAVDPTDEYYPHMSLIVIAAAPNK